MMSLRFIIFAFFSIFYNCLITWCTVFRCFCVFICVGIALQDWLHCVELHIVTIIFYMFMFFIYSVSYDENDSDTDAPQEDWADWVDQSVRMRQLLRMPTGYRHWVDTNPLEGLSETPRVSEMVQLGWWANLVDARDNERRPSTNWFVDSSQAIKRTPWGAILPTFGQASDIYSYEMKRKLDSEDPWVGMVGVISEEGVVLYSFPLRGAVCVMARPVVV